MTFTGIEGKGKWGGTVVEGILPVTMLQNVYKIGSKA